MGQSCLKFALAMMFQENEDDDFGDELLIISSDHSLSIIPMELYYIGNRTSLR